ncbi:MAG TPA: sialidase family protein [Tepidisphaeraceae bacterium]|nr:sialidase family protein [Tepidisphaeraceae bacterium]
MIIPPWIEQLEDRQLLAANPIPANINLSKMRGSQSEGAVTVDPTNANRIFVVSNIDRGDGLFTARSSDGGGHWSKKVIADGFDGLVSACCDSSAAFDEFGNLFVGYINGDTDQVLIIRSGNGGQSFSRLESFSGDIDQPTLTAGEHSVWVTFEQDEHIFVSGARVTGLGQIGSFSEPEEIDGSRHGNFGDIAIGPEGQVMVSYQTPAGDRGPSKIYVNVDDDGVGPHGFGPARLVSSTNVGGFRRIPAQRSAKIDAEVGLAYDRSGGQFDGRVYLVYTVAPSTTSNNTDIRVRFSDDDGGTWSSARKVNTDKTKFSQFLPRIAVDQTSGNIAFAWYDSRNDKGAGSSTTNRASNDDAQLWAAAARPTASGMVFSRNLRISAGTFNADRANNTIDLGDYIGLTFRNGVFWPVWADNSNSTRDNPNGRLRGLDLYTARVVMPVI